MLEDISAEDGSNDRLSGKGPSEGDFLVLDNLRRLEARLEARLEELE